MSEDGKNKLGMLSLILAIGGVAIPIALALLLVIIEWLTKLGPPYFLCVLLFVGLQIIALVTGIIGRQSPFGKAGMVVSATLLVLTAIAAPFLMVSSSETSGPSMTERAMDTPATQPMETP